MDEDYDRLTELYWSDEFWKERETGLKRELAVVQDYRRILKLKIEKLEKEDYDRK